MSNNRIPVQSHFIICQRHKSSCSYSPLGYTISYTVSGGMDFLKEMVEANSKSEYPTEYVLCKVQGGQYTVHMVGE